MEPPEPPTLKEAKSYEGRRIAKKFLDERIQQQRFYSGRVREAWLADGVLSFAIQ